MNPVFRPNMFVLIGAIALVAMACSDSSGGDSGSGGSAQPADCEFDSTFAAIQTTVFEAKGCSVSACHGDSLQGDLDLRAGASFGSLVRETSTINDAIERVFPGDQDRSLLYRKLTDSTDVLASDGLGQAMPVDADPLTDDQAEAMRLWIRAGAPETGYVAGTLNLLGCEGSFSPDPNKINPLPAPPAGEGVQFYSGGWDILRESEDEVCFATYYDLTDVVPAEFVVGCDEFGEGRECFAFGRNELAQDALSHHSIITVFTRDSDPNGSEWGPWECLGGDLAGQACDPAARGACGARSSCATPPRTNVACVGYPFAPPDFSLGAGIGGGIDALTSAPLSGAQESTQIDLPPEGVYTRLPLKGFISWNSHGFNLTTKDTTIEQWVNLSFVPENGRQWLQEQIFEAGDIFAMSDVAPFSKREVCTTFDVPQYARLSSLSSHMHERGELFRIWLPPNAPCAESEGCLAPERAPDYESRLYDDPVYLYYDPPIAYDNADETERTFKACARYDNGADIPAEVKRNSISPNTPVCGFIFANCGCEPSERACYGGSNQGLACRGDDSMCGDGGMCDACPVAGGVTTADEMFIPLGTYHVVTPP